MVVALRGYSVFQVMGMTEYGQKSKPKKIKPMKPKKSLDQKSTHIPMLNIVKMVYWY